MAGKYDDPNQNKDHFKAKGTWEYLKALDSEDAPAKAQPLYEELCQISHPSRESTALFFHKTEVAWVVEDFNQLKAIDDLEHQHLHSFDRVFQSSFNASLVTLWIIHQLEINGLRCNAINDVDMSAIGEFQKVKEKVRRFSRV